jgi:hypothetical protein
VAIYNRRTKTTPFKGYDGRIVDYPLRADAAAEWFREMLPSAAEAAVDWANGGWTAPLPAGTPESAANDFRRGVLAEPPPSTWESVDVEHIGPDMAARIAATLDCSASELVRVPKVSLVFFPAQWVVDHLRSSPSAVALIRNMGTRHDPDAVTWTSSSELYIHCLARRSIGKVLPAS